MLSAPPAQDNPSQTTSLPKLCARRFHIFPNYPPPAKEIYVCKQHHLLVFLQINSSSRQCAARCLNAPSQWAPSLFYRSAIHAYSCHLYSRCRTNRDRLTALGQCEETETTRIFLKVLCSNQLTSLLPETPPNQNPKHLSDNLDNAISFIKSSTAVFGQHFSEEHIQSLESRIGNPYPIRP